MTGEPNSLICTQPDAVAEVLSAKSCHIVLETSRPDYVEKISRYLESCAGQSNQDKVSNEPAEAESDSGDSLFITQKPVPEAVRSRRRRHYKLRSNPTSPGDLEESESDTSSSASHGESKTDRQKCRRKKYRLPKYSFPFLSERKWKPSSTVLPVQQNISLNHSAMGGFFKCVREVWQGTGAEVESSLPTVDMDGDYISPLSEEEGRSEDEDIKVVERKCFSVPSKAKNRQTWCNHLKQQRRRRKAGNATLETAQGRHCKAIHKTPVKEHISRATPLSLDTESTDGGESSCRVLVQRERNDELVTSVGNFMAQKETPRKKRCLSRGKKKILFLQKEKEEELCDDSDATVCEPHKLQRSPRQYTQKGTDASTTATEPHTLVFHTDNLSQIVLTEDEPESQSLLRSLPDCRSETDDAPIAAKSANVDVEETPCLSEDKRAEENNERNFMENSSHDETIVRQEEREIPNSKRKKKKRKMSAVGKSIQEEDENLGSDVTKEDSVFPLSYNMENGGKEEKKKKSKRTDEHVEQFQSGAAAEPQNDGAEIQMKKKKRKKKEKVGVAEECEQEGELRRALDFLPVSMGQLEESGNCLENNKASEETLESSQVKRKKHKKKKQSSSNDGEEGVDVRDSNDAVTLEESTGMSLKQKKKTVYGGVDISHISKENEKVEDRENTQKTKEGPEDQNDDLVTKKKKKKRSENSGRNISEDIVAQSDDSVSVRKKEKKRTSSFLIADVEEEDAQTHPEQICPSQSVEAHVWGAEKPAVSAGDFETKSAEIAGNLEECNDGVRKKKRKRKVSVEQESVEKDHKPDFEEPIKTCQQTWPEATGVKRRKERMGKESELMTPMEILESAADAAHSQTDEALVLKKKKKKKKYEDELCHIIQESPAAATIESELEKSSMNTCSSASPKKKGKHLTSPSVIKGKNGGSTDLFHDGSTSDQGTEETLNMVEEASVSSETPGNEALNDMRDKKKKKKMKSPDKNLLEGTKSVNLEPQENKKKEKKERKKQSAVLSITSSSPMSSETILLKSEVSPSDHSMKNKHMRVKRTLHNSSEDFLTDY